MIKENNQATVILEGFSIEREIVDKNNGMFSMHMKPEYSLKTPNKGSDKEVKKEDPLNEFLILYHIQAMSDGSVVKKPVSAFPIAKVSQEELVSHKENDEKIKLTFSKEINENENDKVISESIVVEIDPKDGNVEVSKLISHKDGTVIKKKANYNAAESNYSFVAKPSVPAPIKTDTKENPEVEIIKEPQYSNKEKVTNRIKSINEEYSGWRNDKDYQLLSKSEKEKIESEDSLKKLYGYIYRGNVAGVSTLLQSGVIKNEQLNSNHGYALRLSTNMGNMDVVETLIQNGADPRGIDVNQLHNPEIKEYIEQKIYERNNPIKSAIGFRN